MYLVEPSTNHIFIKPTGLFLCYVSEICVDHLFQQSNLFFVVVVVVVVVFFYYYYYFKNNLLRNQGKGEK